MTVVRAPMGLGSAALVCRLIDDAPWGVDCDRYDPPYFVAPEVLAAEEAVERRSHPEDFEKAADLANPGRSETTDDMGRALNPRGRTGLAGRGLLKRWGANPGVAAVVVRRAADGDGFEFLVGKQADQLGVSLPRDLLELGESADDGLRRLLSASAGVDLGDIDTNPIFDDFFYDLAAVHVRSRCGCASASERQRSSVASDTPSSRDTAFTGALSGGNNRDTARSLNACPYLAIASPPRPSHYRAKEATTILTQGGSIKKQAHRLLTKDHIRREVGKRTADQAAEVKITREQVINGLVTAYEVAKSLYRSFRFSPMLRR